MRKALWKYVQSISPNQHFTSLGTGLVLGTGFSFYIPYYEGAAVGIITAIFIYALILYEIKRQKDWMKRKPGTTTFNNPNGDNQYFRQYPSEYKKFFDELEHMDGGFAVMVQDNRQNFRELVAEYPDNPFFGDK